MCIIIDSNTLAAVFNTSDSQHTHFKHVFDHINSGKSRMIIGGTRFNNEIRLMRKYTKYLSELKKAGKLIYQEDEPVDILEAKIDAKFSDPLFNDKHIVALAYISNARLVCTKDKILESYLQKREFYNKNKRRPKIFNESSRSTDLPCGAFRPKCKLC